MYFTNQVVRRLNAMPRISDGQLRSRIRITLLLCQCFSLLMLHLRVPQFTGNLRSKSAVSDVLGPFNSLVTRSDIFIKRSNCIIICIFIEKGKNISAKGNSIKSHMQPRFYLLFKSPEKHRKPL